MAGERVSPSPDHGLITHRYLLHIHNITRRSINSQRPRHPRGRQRCCRRRPREYLTPWKMSCWGLSLKHKQFLMAPTHCSRVLH